MKIFALILVFGVLFVLISFFFMGRASAKGSALGLVDGTLAPLSTKPNCVSSEAGTDQKKLVAPLPTSDLGKIKAAITAMGGEVTSETTNYISTTFTSKTFKFVDDLEVRIDGDSAQVRSCSRAGYSDRGVNKARVMALAARL